MAQRRAAGQASSPFAGVSWDKDRSKWTAVVTGGVKHNLGLFVEEEDAARAGEAEARSERAAELANAALTHGIDAYSRSDSKGSGMVGGWRVAARAEERSVSFGWRMHAPSTDDDFDYDDEEEDDADDAKDGLFHAEVSGQRPPAPSRR
mgnify:CR=1 FL=1